MCNDSEKISDDIKHVRSSVDTRECGGHLPFFNVLSFLRAETNFDSLQKCILVGISEMSPESGFLIKLPTKLE